MHVRHLSLICIHHGMQVIAARRSHDTLAELECSRYCAAALLFVFLPYTLLHPIDPIERCSHALLFGFCSFISCILTLYPHASPKCIIPFSPSFFCHHAPPHSDIFSFPPVHLPMMTSSTSSSQARCNCFMVTRTSMKYQPSPPHNSPKTTFHCVFCRLKEWAKAIWTSLRSERNGLNCK